MDYSPLFVFNVFPFFYKLYARLLQTPAHQRLKNRFDLNVEVMQVPIIARDLSHFVDSWWWNPHNRRSLFSLNYWLVYIVVHMFL
jgi:hypothetical protein